MSTKISGRGRFAAKFALGHFVINMIVAALVAALVFGVWYPAPYAALMGGLHLFGLIVAVDVVCGPVLTAVLANPEKSKRELLLDLSLVGAIQLAALLYGLHAVAEARPVYAAFEVDRFTVVSAAEIDKTQLEKAAPKWRQLPLSGVERIALREPKDADEKMKSLEMSLQGIEPSARPDWWLEEKEADRQKIREKMQPLSKLIAKYPDNQELKNMAAKTGLPESSLYYLPFTSQKVKDWVVVMDQQTNFRGFLPLDGFE